MTWWDTVQLLAIANLGVCLGIIWTCICRLNSNVCRRWLAARMRYTLLLTAALAHGLQPVLFGTWPGIAGLIFAVGVLVNLLLGVQRWRSWTMPARHR